MLVTPTLEWQDHLSSCYALMDKHHTPDSSVNPGIRSSPQRRRLDNDSASPADWGQLYKFETGSGGCSPPLPQCPYLINPFLISDSDDTDDLSRVGELSLDENREVRIDVTTI